MFSNILFFTYILAGFVGIIAIIMVVLIIRHRREGNRQLLTSAVGFLICTIMVDIMYFYSCFEHMITSMYMTYPIVRILDMATYIGQVYFLAAYINERCGNSIKTNRRVRITTISITAVCSVLTVVLYGFMMDDYYYLKPGLVRTEGIILEVIINVLLAVMLIAYLLASRKKTGRDKIVRLNTSVVVGTLIYGVWNSFVVINLMCGQLDDLAAHVEDLTPVFLLFINLLALNCLYREDFSPFINIDRAFSAGSMDSGENVKEKIDLMAKEHLLTARECEVVRLAYEGMTNPEIAESLFISQYTVKRHMHNIFEKLGISTRIELIHLLKE